MSADFVTNEQVVLAARKNLTQFAWDYLTGGGESETTLRRNRLAFDRVAFRPRILRDVSKIDTSVPFLGTTLRAPVIFAPIGSMQHLSPDGAVGFAKAAAQYGTVMTHAQTTQPSLEAVAEVDKGGLPRIFQMYVMGDDAWTVTLLQRVRDAGYDALCLTVDTPYHSRRDRSLHYANAGPLRGEVRRSGPNYLASVTWDTLDRIRETWGGHFMLKGVTSSEDAALAVEHGVDTVWVSNHGGRQLDGALGALDVLPEVVEAIGGRAQVVFDSGVLRGADVAKALALGADVVAIGKLQGWGMAAGGVDGLVRSLEILEAELVSAMGLMGLTCIDQLDESYLTRAASVTPPHEMSSWPNMPGGRLL